MNTKNNKVSFILIDDLNHAVKDNEPDEHFQFVQNLAKNFDKSRFIKTDYKRSSSGVDVSTSSCCSNSSCISLNNRCVEVSNEFKHQYNLFKDDKELNNDQKMEKNEEYSNLKDINLEGM